MFTLNIGQFCGAPTRLIVHESLHDEFVKKVVGHMQQQKLGRWSEEGVTNGPVASQKQLDRILSYIKIGQEEGAKIVAGGKRLPREGFFVEPTLFTGVKNNMRIAQEEIFGPVAVVIKFKETDEAIAIANDNRYGLFGGVFSRDAKTCHEVARRVDVGNMAINNYFMFDYDAAFGGFKHSGVGRDLGPEALSHYFEYKTITQDFN